MRAVTTSIILLILSVILININISELVFNPIIIIMTLLIIALITFVLTYLNNSVIIPLIISLVPLITKFNSLTSFHTMDLYTGYYRSIELFKNFIMLLSVLSAVFFRIFFEKNLPKDPLINIHSLLKHLRDRKKINSKITIITNILISFGVFFYISYIIAAIASPFLEKYLSGIIVSGTLLIINALVQPFTIDSIVIISASWFSPILFLASLSDLKTSPGKTQLSNKGVFLGRIRAKLSFTKGSLKIYEFVDIDEKIPLKDKWTWIETKGEYYYDPQLQENPHILIVGSSGTGKSTLASIISCGLHDYIRSAILVIDFHGEYNRLIKTVNPSININVINSLENKISILDIISEWNIRERSLEISSIIQRIFNLGPLQRIFLQRVIEEAYAIISETGSNEGKALLEAYNIVLENARTDQELRGLRSLEPYVKTLASEFFGTKNIAVDNLFKDITIIDLSPLYSEYFKNLYAELILLKVYDNLHIINTNVKGMKYIVIDEAHRIANNSDNVLAKITAESRKYNIGVIVSTQHPRNISENIIGNTALQIILQLKEPLNLEYAAKLIAGYHSDNRLDAIKKAIYYLPRFHGLVKDSLIREPLLIDFTRKLGDRNG